MVGRCEFCFCFIIEYGYIPTHLLCVRCGYWVVTFVVRITVELDGTRFVFQASHLCLHV